MSALAGAQPRSLPRSVLIVDDDPFIRKLIATTLQDVSHFEVHQAGDGLEALEVARRRRPALIFLDVDMPRCNGIDACRQIRAEPATRDATIVMLTGSTAEAVHDQARAAGASLFLTKPFSPLQLLKLVDSLAHGAGVHTDDLTD